MLHLASGIRHAARTVDLDSVRVTGEPPIRVKVVHTLRDQRIPNPKIALHTLAVRDPCRGGVGKLALTCTDFRRVAGETMKTKRAAVLERIHKLTHKRDTSATYQPSDLKRLYRVMPDLLEHALADLRAWGYAKDPFHPLGGPDLEHNVIADQINESFCGRGCTCLICPKREIRMNPKIDDEFD